jgi:arylsulfatase A-like enzyme
LNTIPVHKEGSKIQAELSRRGFLASAAASSNAQTRRPRNVLLFVIDGQRADMMGCAGNSILKTPHLDALAARGARFTRSFSAHSVCMPSRATLLTGRYPGTHGVLANGVPLPKSEITLPRVLSGHGYATSVCGKLHLEPQQMAEYPPRIPAGQDYYGFREVHLSENLPGPEYLGWLEKNFPELATNNGHRRKGIPVEAHLIHFTVNNTLEFMERKIRERTPFFVQCSFPYMTPPDSPPRGFVDMYDPRQMPPPKRQAGELDRKPPHYRRVHEYQLAQKRYPDDESYRRLMADYYAMMMFIDSGFGRLVQALEKQGELDNTLIVVTSDHGLCLGDHWIWRHGPWLYDLVINVPLLIFDPAAKGARVVSELVESADIMPTVLDLLGIPSPEGVQGKSLRPLLEGAPGAKGKETIWVEDSEAMELKANGVDPTGFHVIALRSREWKLVHYVGQSYGELYHLTEDPDEFRNLWDDPSYRTVRNEYNERLVDRLIRSRSGLPRRTHHW